MVARTVRTRLPPGPDRPPSTGSKSSWALRLLGWLGRLQEACRLGDGEAGYGTAGEPQGARGEGHQGRDHDGDQKTVAVEELAWTTEQPQRALAEAGAGRIAQALAVQPRD